MGTSSLSVGRGVGLFGVWPDDVWHGVLVWRIKPTRASMRKDLLECGQGTELRLPDSKTRL